MIAIFNKRIELTNFLSILCLVVALRVIFGRLFWFDMNTSSNDDRILNQEQASNNDAEESCPTRKEFRDFIGECRQLFLCANHQGQQHQRPSIGGIAKNQDAEIPNLVLLFNERSRRKRNDKRKRDDQCRPPAAAAESGGPSCDEIMKIPYGARNEYALRTTNGDGGPQQERRNGMIPIDEISFGKIQEEQTTTPTGCIICASTKSSPYSNIVG